MRNLAFLLVRYGGIGLFVLLELLCLYLIVNYNQKQKEIWLNFSDLIFGKVYDIRDNFTRYYRLSTQADSLAADNARLKAKLKNAMFVTNILKDSVNNEILEQKYTFTAARVISSTVNTHTNTLTLDRGRKHEVELHMGVMDANPKGGIVGIIRNASGNYSQVMSILHREARVSAAIKRNGYHGFLSWNPGDVTKINLIDVPKHADIVIGDTIQTSEYSGMFPAGIMIATVDTFYQASGSNFHTIEASLVNDLGNVKYVYIVNNIHKTELFQLEKEGIDE